MKFSLVLSTLLSLASVASATEFNAEAYLGKHYLQNHFLMKGYNQSTKIGEAVIDGNSVQFKLDGVKDSCQVKVTSSKALVRKSSLTQGAFVEVDRSSVNQIEISDGLQTVRIEGLDANHYLEYRYGYQVEGSSYVEGYDLIGLESTLHVEVRGEVKMKFGFGSYRPRQKTISYQGRSVTCVTDTPIYLK